ncbi:hypothetical protein NPIL_688201 [Nephila pilipes]|uniref:Uncharacterized protein n=1 Tax=Nephila pilipes TaxID=299642 RepID=A0A8X6P220_NEPPI|nr:hypothetical protein NPIL_688201 [Nephila pilipes]
MNLRFTVKISSAVFTPNETVSTVSQLASQGIANDLRNKLPMEDIERYLLSILNGKVASRRILFRKSKKKS